MSLTQNLEYANQAIQATAAHMVVGASNKLRDVLSSWGDSLLCVPATRSVKIATPNSRAVPSFIREAALKAIASGCGNCGEQAAIAYLHLVEVCKVQPVDYVSLTNADHACVIIGRLTENSRDEHIGAALPDLKTWGANAAVCDPWHGKAYAATNIPAEMYRSWYTFGTFSAETLWRYSGGPD